MWQFWLILAGFFLIIEIINTSFLIFWFAIGALFAVLASFFIDSIIVQSTIFLIASIILLFATKPFVQKVMRKRRKRKN